MSTPVPEGLLNYEGIPLSAEEQRKINRIQRLMRSPIGAIAFALFGFLSPIPALLYLAAPVLALRAVGLLSAKTFQKLSDLVVGQWYFVMVLLFERMFGIRTRAFGFNGEFKRRCIFIMNHVSHFDWMFFWCVAERQGDLHIWKSVTKDMMKKVPFVGFAMQYAEHIFITRRWEQDSVELREKLYYYNGISYPIQLLLFPEGGDLTPRSLAKSNSYADQNGLPRYKFCLHPRTTGLTYVINAMRDGGLDAIYDVTIGYPDLISKTELDFGRGHMPREVHYHIQEFKDSELPQTDEGMAEWCRDRWKEKEERLRDFYTHKEFREKVSSTSCDDSSTVYQRTPEVLRGKKHLQLAISLVYFTVMITAVYYFTVNYWICAVYEVCVLTWVAYLAYNGRGLDYRILSFSQPVTDKAVAAGERGLRFIAKLKANGMSSGSE